MHKLRITFIKGTGNSELLEGQFLTLKYIETKKKSLKFKILNLLTFIIYIYIIFLWFEYIFVAHDNSTKST